MALTNCPECSHEVSSKAQDCPHCGYQIRKPKKPPRKVGIIPGLLVIIVALWAISKIFPDQSAANQQPSVGDIASMKAHYRNYPVGGGWEVSDVDEYGHNIAVYVDIPNAQARRIMDTKTREQYRAIRAACPGGDPEIRSTLASHRVMIRARVAGSVFAETEC